jgi:uncharacterized RDD family membrane protein YckC
MFIILGGDGKEYGPVTADQVRAWMAAGRANLDTQAKALGSEEWRRLVDFAEFAPGGGTPPLVRGDTPASPDHSGSSLVPEMTSFSAPVTTLELAGRGTRLGAFIIDRVIAALCALPGVLLMGPAFATLVLAASRGEEPNLEEINAASFFLGAAVAGLGWLVQFGVQLWMLTTRGQSIGKRLLNIRIVLFQDNGPPGFLHAWLLRNFVPGIISLVPYLGFIFVLVDALFIFSEQRRCIHDHIAGTKVVKA